MTHVSISDKARTDLKVIVERAVRPVQALLPRKLKMREELLGHVTAVFEEELARTGDEAAALAVTADRFGDPREVAAELQRTVPAHERPFLWIEQRTARRPDESIVRRATRIAVLVAAIAAGELAVTLVPLAAIRRDASHPWIAVQVVGAATIGAFVLTFGLSLLSELLRRAAFDRAEARSPVRIGLVAVAAALLPVVVLGIFAFVMLGRVSDVAGFLQWQFSEGPLTAALLLVPAGLYVAAWAIDQEQRSIREWADLQIE